MTEINATFVDELIGLVGAERVKRAADLDSLDPGCHPDNLAARFAVAPVSTQEVSAVLSLCHRRGIGVVPHGGRTGLAGGAVPAAGQLVLLTSALNTRIEIDLEAAVAVAGAGVVLETLEFEARRHDLTTGIDIAARGSATIGGMISTNAGGGEAFRNGIMRHRVLGLEAVLPDGTVVADMKRVTKANEGPDVKQLFIGAEGILGVVTRAVLRLQPQEGARTTVLAGCPSAAAAVRVFAALRAAREVELLAAEIMWRDYVRTAAADLGLDEVVAFADCPVYVIYDVSAAGSDEGAVTGVLARAAESGDVTDAVFAKNESEQERIWRIREDSWAIDRRHPHGLWYDVSVPQGRLDDYVARVSTRVGAVDADYRVFVMGHLGDGNLHLTISRSRPSAGDYPRIAAAVYDGLAEMGGSFSAEHGIGTEKKGSLPSEVDPGKLALMRMIKRSLDPKDIMNPGKVL